MHAATNKSTKSSKFVDLQQPQREAEEAAAAAGAARGDTDTAQKMACCVLKFERWQLMVGLE